MRFQVDFRVRSKRSVSVRLLSFEKTTLKCNYFKILLSTYFDSVKLIESFDR